MPSAIPVRPTPAQRATLRGWAYGRSTPQALARRARTVLACADGGSDTVVARQEGTSRTTVARWRRRFAAEGTAGLTDRPRPGRPPAATAHVRRIRSLLQGPPPGTAGVWSTRRLAAATGLSQTTVVRLLRAPGVRAPGSPYAPRQRPAAPRNRVTAPSHGTRTAPGPRPGPLGAGAAAPVPSYDRAPAVDTYDSRRRDSRRPQVEPRLADTVVLALREEIAGGRYRAGERITEAALAARLGVSRGPIRDALRVLAEDGLLEVPPNRGAVIPQPHSSDIIETYAARATLGSLLVRRLAARGPGHLAPVGAALAEVPAAARRGDIRQTAEADLRFQDAVARAAGLPRASVFFTRLTMQLRMFVAVLRLDYSDSRDAMVTQDTAIFDALCAQSGRRAAAAWRTKIEHAVRTMIDQIPGQDFDQRLWQTLTGVTPGRAPSAAG